MMILHSMQTCILLEGSGRNAKTEMNKLYAEMGKMQASVEQMATMRDHWEKDATEARKIMKEQVSTSPPNINRVSCNAHNHAVAVQR